MSYFLWEAEGAQGILNKYAARISKILKEKVTLEVVSRDEFNDPVDELGYSVRGKSPSITNLFSFYLTELPGCCGICVAYHSSIHPAYYNKGLGSILTKLKVELAKNACYTKLLCTNHSEAVPHRKIMDKNDFTIIDTFVNKRTDNELNVYMKDL